MCEKGYDNVFLLSGGGEAFLEDYQNLCEGPEIPIPKKQLELEAEMKAAEKKAIR